MSNEIATKLDRVPVVDHGEFANLLDSARFEHLWRVATAFSKSDLVPSQFRGKPENCFIALQMAIRVGVDPYMFLQNCYVVSGRPGIETKLAIALLNKSGRIDGSLKYRFEGDGKNITCTAYCVEKGTGEILEHTLDWRTVEAEGWLTKQGSKWRSDPQLMLQYRAAIRLIRLHFPEVLLGMCVAEEAEEEGTVEGKATRVQAQAPLRITERLESRHPVDEPEDDRGDAWEEPANGQLFETHPNAAEL